VGLLSCRLICSGLAVAVRLEELSLDFLLADLDLVLLAYKHFTLACKRELH
jgi:hypothetical protein